MNSPELVWQNFLSMAVIIFVFYWLYANMEENRFKKSIRDFFGKIKENMKNDD